MKLQDNIHYYIGCDVFLCKNLEGNNVIEPLTTKMLYEDMDMFIDPEDPRPFKIILRKLEDATFKEIGEMRLIRDSITNRIEKYAAVTKYLTSIGIDVFGLIKSGLAIDSKTLK